MADDRLPALGELSYNGFDFTAYTETVGVRVKPVYGGDGRVVVHNEYAFTFRTVIADATDTSDRVDAARRALTKPGGEFTFTDRGFGDLEVNVGNVRDVAWGPKPRELAFRHLGADRACELTWTLEVAVPDCDRARYEFAPAEFVWTLTWDVDRSGYTTRTYKGYVRIPLTRDGADGRAVNGSADEYREQIYPKPLDGFRRTPGVFELSADRTRLDFTVTDEEMPPNVPPPEMIDVQADYSLSTQGAAFTMWFASLNATYELAKGADRSKPWGHFLTLWKHYADLSMRQSGLADRRSGAAGAIPVSFTVREPTLYGRTTAAFSAVWRFTSNLTLVLNQSGLWRPVPDSDWRRWAGSLAGVLGPRGAADLEFDAGEDRLIDLCDRGRPVPPADSPAGAELRGGQTLGAVFPRPPAGHSWLEYQCWVEVETEMGTVATRAVPEAELRELRTGGPQARDILKPGGALPAAGGGGGGLSQFFGRGGRLDNQTAAPAPRPTGTLVPGPVKDPPPAEVQRRVAPLAVVYLCGHALRAGHPIPMPALTLLNGVRPAPANRLDRGEGFFGPAVVGNCGVPIYGARWRLRYVLPEVPAGGIPTPPNPLLGGL